MGILAVGIFKYLLKNNKSETYLETFLTVGHTGNQVDQGG